METTDNQSLTKKAISRHFVAHNSCHDHATMGAQANSNMGVRLVFKLRSGILNKGHTISHIQGHVHDFFGMILDLKAP